MISFTKKEAVLASALMISAAGVLADGHPHQHGTGSHGHGPLHADHRAPIGVMGDHMHHADNWMFSYRFMRMDMQGNRIGEHGVSPGYIVANVPNRFFGIPGQPPNLRIVPTDMSMNMHMFGAMYVPSDWLTLMGMAMYVDKSMKHVTYNPMGSATIGTFTTQSSGWGDTRLSGLIRAYDDEVHHVHFNIGLSLPTGSTEKRDSVLTPMGMLMNVRLPYPMQLGSGTVDLLPGVTYSGRQERWTWGAQYLATLRTGKDNGYSLGDVHDLSGWVGYRWRPWIGTSVRLAYSHQDKIDGIDPQIVGPVQTADPDFQGGETLNLLLGVDLAGQSAASRGHRLAIEAGFPLERDLNGPQMETDLTLTAGWQYAF